MDRLVNENIPNGREFISIKSIYSYISVFFLAHRIDVDNYYTFEYPDQRRR